MIISERIINVRKSNGLNQVQFGKKLNLTKQTISNYETGSRTPGLDIILNIADIFSVSTDYLLGRSDYKTTQDLKLSTYNIFSTKAIDNLSNYTKKKLKLLNTLFLIDGFDSLLKLFCHYQDLPDEEVATYGAILYQCSNEPKVSAELTISYVKKVYMKSLFNESIGEILTELDRLEFDRNVKELNEENGNEKIGGI